MNNVVSVVVLTVSFPQTSGKLTTVAVVIMSLTNVAGIGDSNGSDPSEIKEKSPYLVAPFDDPICAPFAA
jgi:hypothetical protein